MQNHYNLVYREEEREMMPLCREEGIGVIPWSPLARGFLAGNRRKDGRRRDDAREERRASRTKLYYADSDFTIADRVGELARRRGVKPTQIALAWLLAQPGVTAPIVGASKLAASRRRGRARSTSRLDATRTARSSRSRTSRTPDRSGTR